jgi:hypothetical protein
VGLTCVRGSDRRRRQLRRAPLSLGEGLLLAVSAVVALAIVLAYAGRMRADAWNDAGRPAPIDLNGDVEPRALDAALGAAFAHPADRRFAARAITEFPGKEGARVARSPTSARWRASRSPPAPSLRIAPW